MKKSGQRTAAGIFFLILCAVLLSGLPLLIFRPIKQKSVIAVPKERFTFMTNQQTGDKYGLHYWEKTGDPTLFAKPDAKVGFSAFLRPVLNYDLPGRSQNPALPVQNSLVSLPELSLEGVRTPAHFPAVAGFPVILPDPPGKGNIFSAPYFQLEDGTMIPIRGIPAAEAENPTIIFVERFPSGAPPLISIAKSSGNFRLDQLAAAELRYPAAVNEKIKGIVKVEWKQKESAR